MGKVLPNRLYLFLALKWVSPDFCLILYFLFNGFYFGHFQKEKNKSSKQYNEAVVKNKNNW